MQLPHNVHTCQVARLDIRLSWQCPFRVTGELCRVKIYLIGYPAKFAKMLRQLRKKIVVQKVVPTWNNVIRHIG